MSTEVLNLVQGTPEWKAHRAKTLNASEAAAMLGISKYQSRSDLIKLKATGIVPEVDAQTQRIFDQGHAYEALARPWAEDIIGEELYPAVYAGKIEGLPLSASVDGITMLGDVIWEHKTLNQTLREALSQGVIPGEYHPQLEQCLLLTGAEKCLFMASNGNRDEMLHAWYVSVPELRQKIIAGWKQFVADVATYQHVEVAPAAVGRAPDQLPALHIEVTGMVTASNLDAFKAHALAVFEGINTDLNSDEDFADAERTVKWCKDVEDRLEAAKQHALGQTASIDELFRTIDSIKEEARQKRLTLDKAVKSRKDAIRVQLVQETADKLDAHVKQLNERLGGTYMPVMQPNLGESIKGRKTLQSCKESLDTALANAKIEASAIADRIQVNKDALRETDWPLFPDFAQVCLKPAEDFARLVESRREQEQTRIAAAIAAKEAAELARQQAQAAAEQARQDAKAPAPEPERELARELAQQAVRHEEARPSRTTIKLRTQAALAMEGLSEADLMRVIEFIAGLVSQQKKAA